MANYHSNPFHHDGARDADAHAPEAVDMLSPLTPVANLENEMQSRYQSAHDLGRHPLPSPTHTSGPADTEKEVVNVEHDSAYKHVVPLELSSQYPETATSMSPGPQTPWTMDSETLRAKSMSDATAPEALPPRGDDGGQKKEQKILGMSKRVFLIVIVIIIIIIAAGVGGGVGGAVASTKKSDATPATSNSQSSSTSVPTSTTQTSSSTSTASTAPTQTIRFLNNQTWPEGYNFAFQGYSRENFTGAVTEILSGDGGSNLGKDFEFDLHSYIWVQNIGNCCVNLCANSTKQGYLGYKCTPVRRKESTAPVARAFVWCDNTHSDAMAESKGCS